MKRYFAEFIGTFSLVFCGTGAVIINELTHGSVTHVGVALTFGLIVMAMIYTFGDISGAHLNPAVTIGFAFAKRLDRIEILPYVIAQLLGAILASIVLKLLFPQNSNLGTTIPSGSWQQSLILEIILAFILMLVILHVSNGPKEKGITAGLAVGSVITLEALFAGAISGASMNPARSLAPALVSGKLQDVWIYICAPILGLFLAVISCRLTREKGC